MSNPSEVPQPQQPGAQPPASNVPPAGSEPSQGYQPPPPGYQAPAQAYPPSGQAQPSQGQPYGQPGQSGGFHFEMPTDGPKNFNDVMPSGGFSGMFSVTGLPTELKVSYWIWLIGGLLGVLGGVLGLFGSLVLFTVAPGIAVLVLVLVLVALALGVAQIILAMKMKEGKEWARLALTVVAAISLVLAVINGSMLDQGGSWFGFVISLAATVLMWLPNSQAWFAAAKGRV
ncbi:hypothetical protein QFZ30_000566 [Arthrobacter pascens]|uniref:hypothetical protein n=1 Tax=Arthrobacter pascens TaxID=1677 RepID=UPI00278CE34E|nr:hypothetical protein [Arthrobacter pascens]MDQ0677184.1 hypothetical protein [Arthrobacter pascens]